MIKFSRTFHFVSFWGLITSLLVSSLIAKPVFGQSPDDEIPLKIQQHIDPKAVIATNDIGGLAYFTRRDFIDIMGLSSPEIWPTIQRKPGEKLNTTNLEIYLKEHKVEYVLLSPLYYPAMTDRRAVYEPIMEWSERYDHGRTISPQILYRCHWEATA